MKSPTVETEKEFFPMANANLVKTIQGLRTTTKHARAKSVNKMERISYEKMGPALPALCSQDFNLMAHVVMTLA